MQRLNDQPTISAEYFTDVLQWRLQVFIEERKVTDCGIERSVSECRQLVEAIVSQNRVDAVWIRTTGIVDECCTAIDADCAAAVVV